jgi:hypothetical protein
MKHLLLFITALCVTAGQLHAGSPLLEKLQQITGISSIRALESTPYAEAYEFYYEQPLDHEHPERGTFRQYVHLAHRDFQQPVVAILEGYGVNTPRESELSRLFNTNQITIEHRFFNHSIPATGIPWKELTIKQSATDHHRIIQTLRARIYPDTPWITTGISKGGQTTIYHRYFYPEDVEISVPYVAPLNLEYIDPRLDKYLARLGKTPEQRNPHSLVGSGGQENTLRILQFQHACFEHLDQLLPQLEELAADQHLTFTRAGGAERAMKLVILEFPFAFWQWNGNVNEIPESELENIEEIFRYLTRVSPPDFFSDKSILDIQAFYYAALTETGMYAYDIRPFRQYFKGEPNRHVIDFRFTMPGGVDAPPFNEKQMQAINRWLQTDAERMLFIYGARDPWSATAVELKGNDKCKKYVKADAHHGCRVRHFETIIQKDIIDTITTWLAR